MILRNKSSGSRGVIQYGALGAGEAGAYTDFHSTVARRSTSARRRRDPLSTCEPAFSLLAHLPAAGAQPIPQPGPGRAASAAPFSPPPNRRLISFYVLLAEARISRDRASADRARQLTAAARSDFPRRLPALATPRRPPPSSTRSSILPAFTVRD